MVDDGHMLKKYVFAADFMHDYYRRHKIEQKSSKRNFEEVGRLGFFKNWLKHAKKRFLAQWTIENFFIIKPLKTRKKHYF